MRRIHAREDVCIGCRLCEVHCQVEHSASRDIVKAFRREIPPPSRVFLEEWGAISFPLQCRQCPEPSCAYSCISGALRQDMGTGGIQHEPEKCVGCWTCLLVCPMGGVRPDTRGAGAVVRCDLCPDRDTPACVEHCPNEALYEVEEDF